MNPIPSERPAEPAAQQAEKQAAQTAAPRRSPAADMTLKVLLPVEVLLVESTRHIVAEGEDGSFCLQPRHVDFVSALEPGILTFLDAEEQPHYVAIDEGILVKSGAVVRVSTRRAVRGTDLSSLRDTVMTEFRLVDNRERRARSAIARLEADFVRRFLDLGDPVRV